MATEKRLIDANALLERILSLTLTVTGLRAGKGVLLELLNKYRNGILQLVNEQPTVDAVEVVHGRWIEKIDMVASYLAGCEETFYECSVCNSPNFGETPYCPNCGAKMDGGVKNA